MGAESAQPRGMGASRLEYWLGDGTHTVGPAFEFEHLDQGGTGLGSAGGWAEARWCGRRRASQKGMKTSSQDQVTVPGSG